MWWERGKASFPTGGLVILAPETDGWDQPRFTLMRVRFEDVVNFPEDTAGRILSFLGVPVSPAALNQLIYSTSTNLYSLMYEGDISPASINIWKESMNYNDIKTIEDMCWPVMQKIGYEKFTS